LQKLTQVHEERWVLTVPSDPDFSRRIFFGEKRALSVAGGIVNTQRVAVELAHEKLNEKCEWVEVDD
jgi:hypothetical protein